MKCTGCGSEACVKAFYHLCPSCQGEGCPTCSESIIPGIIPGEVDEGCIKVCTDFADPTMDAAIAGTHESLITALTSARDSLMEEEEEANEAF